MASGDGESGSQCQAEVIAKTEGPPAADVTDDKADAPTGDTQDAPKQLDAAEAPANPEPLAPGKDVMILGTPMSGSLGVADEFLEEKQRWRVKFASGVAKNFKAENLQVVKAKKQKRRKRESESRQETPEVADTAPSAQGSRTADACDTSISQIMERIGAALPTALPHRALAEAPAAEVLPEEETPAQEAVAREDSTAVDLSHVSFGGISQIMERIGEAPAIEVNLAGHCFSEKAELVAHVRAIQGRCADVEAGMVANLEDVLLLFHLVMQHSTLAEKLHTSTGSPMKGFQYGSDPRFPKNQCFIILFADGSNAPVSIMKCVNEVFTAGNVDRKRHGNVYTAGPASKRPRPDMDQQVLEIDFGKEKSRAETGLILIREEASAARTWDYVLMDERRRSFAAYLPCPFAGPDLARCFDKARAGTDWRQPEDPRSGEPIPRKTAWMVKSGCACTYRYGGIDVAPQEYSPWLIEIMQMYMPLCGLQDQEAWPDSCNLNLYEDGDMSVGWHADNENLFQGRNDDIRIVSVSLGQTRTFELRTQGIEEDGTRGTCTMRLNNGDLCTMEGLTQKHYHHRVPRDAASEGPRINLTWRWIKQHKPGCPMQQTKMKKRLEV